MLLEGNQEYAQKASKMYSRYPDTKVVNCFITKNNIIKLLQDNHVSNSLDLLVVNIDGNDYWILSEISKVYLPSVITVEYNAKWRPPMQWIMPYNKANIWNGSAWFGASLTSYFLLLASHDYCLVSCDKYGNNAFFVRRVFANLFPEHEQGLNLYMPPRYTNGYGFPAKTRKQGANEKF